MHQRVGQRFDKILVEVGLFAHQLEVDLLLQAARQIPDQPGEATKHLLDGLHARFHHRALQVGRHYVEVGYRLGHGLVATVGAQAHQTVTHQHQLTDHVHDFVEPCGVDPYGGFRFSCMFFRGSGGLGRF